MTKHAYRWALLLFMGIRVRFTGSATAPPQSRAFPTVENGSREKHKPDFGFSHFARIPGEWPFHQLTQVQRFTYKSRWLKAGAMMSSLRLPPSALTERRAAPQLRPHLALDDDHRARCPATTLIYCRTAAHIFVTPHLRPPPAIGVSGAVARRSRSTHTTNAASHHNACPTLLSINAGAGPPQVIL